MFVDALANPLPEGATESTVLGPFYVPGSPLRAYGADISEQARGTPAWVFGRVVDASRAGADRRRGGRRLAERRQPSLRRPGPDAPEHHLRGRFMARADGSYAFRAVRPVPYPIPDDGPGRADARPRRDATRGGLRTFT